MALETSASHLCSFNHRRNSEGETRHFQCTKRTNPESIGRRLKNTSGQQPTKVAGPKHLIHSQEFPTAPSHPPPQ